MLGLVECDVKVRVWVWVRVWVRVWVWAIGPMTSKSMSSPKMDVMAGGSSAGFMRASPSFGKTLPPRVE